MNNLEFVKKVKDVADNYKTLYVYGCFGAPMTAANKKRYLVNTDYNKRADRTAMINAATASTFGFDCVNLIKGILWGWTGDKTKSYGGAKYATNGVPDTNADGFINLCKNVTTDFSKIEVGEAVWLKGHIGVYIGNGLAVECTPKWTNDVQITAVHNIGKVAGYNGRKWTKHGKIPFITYEKVENKPAKAEKDMTSFEKFVRNVQAAIGAQVDGEPGPETLAKTITVSAKYNKKHAVVKAIQTRLYELGYTEIGKADGVAGPKFTSAVAHFQQDNGCAVDGVITKKNKTWKKLLGLE